MHRPFASSPRLVAALRGLALVAGLVAGLLAGTAAAAHDLAGAKDHPLIKRFAGSTIVGYDYKRFDEYLLPTGRSRLRHEDEQAQWASTLAVEER